MTVHLAVTLKLLQNFSWSGFNWKKGQKSTPNLIWKVFLLSACPLKCHVVCFKTSTLCLSSRFCFFHVKLWKSVSAYGQHLWVLPELLLQRSGPSMESTSQSLCVCPLLFYTSKLSLYFTSYISTKYMVKHIYSSQDIAHITDGCN